MTDLVPSNDSISRKALERIIQRAAELQASEREIGDSLTEEQLMELGRDVGLPAKHLRQALLEERTRTHDAGGGWLTRYVGPSRVTAQRTVHGSRTDVENALSHWMTEEELLTVKRRHKQHTSWEPRRDFLASLKRGLGLSGRRYVLSKAKEVMGVVRQLEDGWSHVTLVADLLNTRAQHVAGSAAFMGFGATMTTVAIVLNVAFPVAIIPTLVGLGGGAAIARSRFSEVERVTVALEQVLDRLEHGEVKPEKRQAALPTGSQITKMLRDEFRRHLS